MKKLQSTLISIALIATTNLTIAQPLFGIVTAVPEEAKTILLSMQDKQFIKKGIYQYTTGKLANKSVVVMVMGAGIVNAAVATTNMISNFNPKNLILTGTAGGVKSGLNVGDVIIASKATLFDVGNPNTVEPKWPDFPKNPVREKRDPVTFNSSSNLIMSASTLLKDKLEPLSAYSRNGKKKTAKILFGGIATSDHFPNSDWDALRMQANNIDAVAMETASFLKVCWLYQKPCIAFRGISDLLDPIQKPNKYTEWNKTNAALASENSGALVVKYITSIKD